jgi:hypothetical protein
MKQFALVTATIFALFFAQSANADTLVDFSFEPTAICCSGPPFANAIVISVDSLPYPQGFGGLVTGASGTVNGQQITGFVPGSSISFSPQRTFVGFTTLAGSVNFTYTGVEAEELIYNSAGVLTSSTFGVAFLTPVTATTPLPASAPLFGLALLVLAALGFASKRSKPLVTADGSIPC